MENGKYIQRQNAWKFLKFDGKYKPISRSPMNPSHKNIKETTPQHVLIKLLQTSDKEKNFQTDKKQPPKNNLERNKDKDESIFFIGSCEATFLTCRKKKVVKLKFYTQWNDIRYKYSQRNKEHQKWQHE